MPRDPQTNTHYAVRLGVAVVGGAVQWTADLRDNDRKQVGSAVVGDTAIRALDQLGVLLVEHITQHQED